MYKLKFLTVSIILLLLLSVARPVLDVFARPLALHSPVLGVADSFAIIAASGVTGSGTDPCIA